MRAWLVVLQSRHAADPDSFHVTAPDLWPMGNLDDAANWNDLAIALAQGYRDGEFHYDFCDTLMNDL